MSANLCHRAMKSKKRTQVAGNKRTAEELLEQSLAQPGIKEAIEVYESSELYHQAVAQFNSVIERQQIPFFFTSSSCSIPSA